MTRFRTSSIIACSLFIAVNYLAACQKNTSIREPTPTHTLAPAATPTMQAVELTHPDLEVIAPHNVARLTQIDQWGQGNVHGIALSPDGSLIAVSTTTGIYLYDRKTARQVDYIDIRVGDDSDVKTQTCPVSGNLAFSPDGSILAISNADITLWDIKANSTRTVLTNKIEDTDSIITEIQFSGDGKNIFGIQKRASGYPCYSGWGSLVIYTAEAGRMVFRYDFGRYEEGPGPIFVERDGVLFISFLNAQQRKGYSVLGVNLQTGKILTERGSPTIYSMNNTAAVTDQWISSGENGSGYSEAHIIDLASFEDIEVLKANVALIPRSDRMIIREKQKLTVRNLEGIVTCSKPISAESTPAFLPDIFSLDGRIALSWNYYGDRAGDVRIWDVEKCTISDPILIFPQIARQMSFSRDGRSVLTGSTAGYTFHVFDVQTGRMRFSLSGFDAVFSANGKQVFVVEEKAVNAYDVETGKFSYKVLNAESDYMTDILAAPDGRLIALSNDPYRNYHFFGIDDNAVPGRMPESIDGYPYFSQNGKYMAVVKGGLVTSEIRFWELGTGIELTEWQGVIHSSGFADVVFNSDFTKLAALGTDGYYKYASIWNLPEFSLTKAFVQSFPSSDRWIFHLNFISDDRLLFAYGSDPEAFLFWDTSTADTVTEIPAQVHRSELGIPVIFSPDGRLMAVLGGDGTIHVWGVREP